MDISIDSIIVYLVMFLIISLVFSYFTPQMLTLQSRMVIGQVRKSVNELEAWAKEGRKVALGAITKHGRPKRDVANELDNFLEFFMIEPVHEDPVGIINRLDHVLNVRQKTLRGSSCKDGPEGRLGVRCEHRNGYRGSNGK